MGDIALDDFAFVIPVVDVQILFLKLTGVGALMRASRNLILRIGSRAGFELATLRLTVAALNL